MDHDEFTALVSELSPTLLAYAERRTRCSLVSGEDILAASWEALWRRRAAIPVVPDQRRAWCFAVVRMEIMATNRRCAARITPQSLTEGLNDPVSPATGPEAIAVARYDLAGALSRLREADRALVLARVVDGQSTRDLAYRLGRSEGTIRNRLGPLIRRLCSTL